MLHFYRDHYIDFHCKSIGRFLYLCNTDLKLNASQYSHSFAIVNKLQLPT